MTKVEHWNNLIEESMRGSIGDYIDTVIRAYDELGAEVAGELNITISDMCWARIVCELKQELREAGSAMN